MKRADEAGASAERRRLRVVPTQQGSPEADDYVDSDLADQVTAQVTEQVAEQIADLEEPPALGEREQAILAFERRWWKHAGSKEQGIRDTFGISATRYYQLLNGLLDDPLALAHDPVTVQRLRRLRATRTRSRGSSH